MLVLSVAVEYLVEYARPEWPAPSVACYHPGPENEIVHKEIVILYHYVV